MLISFNTSCRCILVSGLTRHKQYYFTIGKRSSIISGHDDGPPVFTSGTQRRFRPFIRLSWILNIFWIIGIRDNINITLMQHTIYIHNSIRRCNIRRISSFHLVTRCLAQVYDHNYYQESLSKPFPQLTPTI